VARLRLSPTIAISVVTLLAAIGCGSSASDASSQAAAETNACAPDGAIPDHILLNVPEVHQQPDLPNGCEVTSLTMLLLEAGVHADKMTLADQVDKVPFTTPDGLHGNPNDGFVGDIHGHNSFGVFHAPIARLANRYLPGRIVDLTGGNFDDILGQYVGHGRPVWIITSTQNGTFAWNNRMETWHTDTGDVQITWDEHSVVITGYDANTIYINNPNGGQNERYPRGPFRQAWEQMGHQAVSYTGCGAPPVPPVPAPTDCGMQADGNLHCKNTPNIPMYFDTNFGAQVVDTLRSSPSWFNCWGTGQLHPGGNTTWYHTQGDDKGNYGWVPAVDLSTTPDFDADPAKAGLPHCNATQVGR
jgi:uncharacterized protein YvpB